jgi:hypothetical protein
VGCPYNLSLLSGEEEEEEEGVSLDTRPPAREGKAHRDHYNDYKSSSGHTRLPFDSNLFS